MEINKKIVVLDLETTGFKPLSDEITEVGFVILDGVTLEVVGSFDSLVNIEGMVPDKVVEKTGITKELTEKFGLPKDVVKEYVQSALEDAVVVAHNAPFDFSFLDRHFDIEPKLFYDTLTMSRAAFPNERKHDLKTLCDRLKIKLEGHHRALNDASATAQAFKRLIKMPDIYNDINVLRTNGKVLDYRPTFTKEVI